MPPKKQPAVAKKFDPSDYEKPHISVEEVLDIKDAFDLFDKDNDGTISVNELLFAMKEMGYDVKHGAVYTMVNDLDMDGSGEMDFDEFFSIMTQKMDENTSKHDIERVFYMFDKDRNGKIEVDDLRRNAMRCGIEISADDANEIIQRGDLDGDGVVNLEDFYNIMTKRYL